jgi:hypothetical protein
MGKQEIIPPVAPPTGSVGFSLRGLDPVHSEIHDEAAWF